MAQQMSPCLVVIDVQQGMLTFRRTLYQSEEMLRRIAGLLERAREAGVPIFHVQHDGGRATSWKRDRSAGRFIPPFRRDPAKR